MVDFSAWAFPIGRAFGITIRVHILFPFVALGFILRAAYTKDVIPGTWLDVLMLAVVAFVVVLLHELGHCFGARRVDGDAHQVLMWPLGGLAYVDVPRTAWANFVTVAAGPAVNLLICLVAGLAYFWVTDFALRPTWNPFWYPNRVAVDGAIDLVRWSGEEVRVTGFATIVLARLFWFSWINFLFNVLLPAFPLDGGRLFQCALWPRFGYHQATLAAVYAGFVTSLVLGVAAMMTNESTLILLCIFIFFTCQYQWLALLQAEEGMFGYDFSQGYTSLEGEPAAPRRRQPNFFQRWLQRRAAKKLQREQEQRESDERRMDELLQKVQDQGLHALTEEERRFLTRVSSRYKNRQ